MWLRGKNPELTLVPSHRVKATTVEFFNTSEYLGCIVRSLKKESGIMVKSLSITRESLTA